jgi:hypothetical protein
MKNSKLFILILSTLFIQCKKEEDKSSSPDTDATYEVTFDINWNNEDFSVNYPSNPHFSKIIGWSHSSTSTFFNLETMASKGIKEMAELGATSALKEEITDKINDGEGYELVVGENLGSGVGKIIVEVNVNKENPSVTLSTMLAPSPDWYLAAVNINLLVNVEFVVEKIVTALMYDAGTDSGTDYISSNQITDPQQPITNLAYIPLSNGAVISTVEFRKK